MLEASSMDQEYDLTVATVCRNAMDVLPRCIESVQPLYQSPLKVEHLLVDGASTDNSVPYLQTQLEQGRITRFVSEPDKGLYDAMNKAIRLAKGHVIVFINADDEICPNGAIACCAPILANRVEYAVGCAQYIDEKGREQKYIVPCLDVTLWRQPYCHQSMYCSTKLLRRFGGFNWKKFRIGADTELMRRLYADNVSCEVVPEVASRFYYGGVSTTDHAVRTEVYELMLHFCDAYCKELRLHPHKITEVMNFLRYYAIRKIEISQVDSVPENDKERIRNFVLKLSNCIIPIRRVFLSFRLRLQAKCYARRAKVLKGKKKTLCMLSSEACQIIANALK